MKRLAVVLIPLIAFSNFSGAAQAAIGPAAPHNLGAALRALFPHPHFGTVRAATVAAPAQSPSASPAPLASSSSLIPAPVARSPVVNLAAARPSSSPAAGAAAPQQPAAAAAAVAAAGAPPSSPSPKPVVTPLLATPAGAVALMPGLQALPPTASDADKMSHLFKLLQTPEEVVKNSALVTVPNALQATLAQLASTAMRGAEVVVPDGVQAELTRVLKGAAAAGGKNILVPAGSTGMVFSPEIQAAIRG